MILNGFAAPRVWLLPHEIAILFRHYYFQVLDLPITALQSRTGALPAVAV
jgi:hypothetical protein